MNEMYIIECVRILMQRYNFTNCNFDKQDLAKIEEAMKHMYFIAFSEGERSATKNFQ